MSVLKSHFFIEQLIVHHSSEFGLFCFTVLPAPAIPELLGVVRPEHPSAAAQVVHPLAEPHVPAVGRRRRPAGAPLVHSGRVGDVCAARAVPAAPRAHSVCSAAPGRHRHRRQGGGGTRLRARTSGEHLEGGGA